MEEMSVEKDTQCMLTKDNLCGCFGRGIRRSTRSPFPFCKVLLPLEVINDFLAVTEHGGVDEGVESRRKN